MTKAAESDCLSAIEKPHRGTAAPRPHARCSETAPAPRRLIFQLIGRGKDALVEATRRLGDTPYAGIDLNFGCSAPQIRKSGAGIAWTRDHARAAQLAAAVRRAVPSNKSVSVKLRLADDGEPQHSLELARRPADPGIDFITVHPRRMSDSYSRPARRAVIEQFSRGLNIPVVASGDVQKQAGDPGARDAECRRDCSTRGRLLRALPALPIR